MRLGATHGALNDWPAAVAAYTTALQLDPGNDSTATALKQAKAKAARSKPAGGGAMAPMGGMPGSGTGGMPGMPPGGMPGGLAAMMQNPAMMQQAQAMMQNPAMMQQAMAMMGGMGGGGGMPGMPPGGLSQEDLAEAMRMMQSGQMP